MDILIENLFRKQDCSHFTVPAFFVKSTAPVNVEDLEAIAEDVDQPTLKDVVELLYQKRQAGPEEAGLVIAIHGYNTGSEEASDGVRDRIGGVLAGAMVLTVLVLNGQRSPLRLWDYIRLFTAFAAGKRDVHGGYFQGAFAQLLIHRLAFLGFEGLLDFLLTDASHLQPVLPVQAWLLSQPSRSTAIFTILINCLFFPHAFHTVSPIHPLFSPVSPHVIPKTKSFFHRPHGGIGICRFPICPHPTWHLDEN
jgi:hypothetical protein